MNTIRFSSFSAAVVLASFSALSMAQADMTATATTSEHKAAVAVSMQQQHKLQPNSGHSSTAMSADSSVAADATAQATTTPANPAQPAQPAQPAAGLPQPATMLSQSSAIHQQSSAAISALGSKPTVALPELPTLSLTGPTEGPQLPDLAKDTAQAAVSQSTQALVQQHVSTELTKALDNTIKAEVVNSVQSSLNSALTLGF